MHGSCDQQLTHPSANLLKNTSKLNYEQVTGEKANHLARQIRHVLEGGVLQKGDNNMLYQVVAITEGSSQIDQYRDSTNCTIKEIQ